MSGLQKFYASFIVAEIFVRGHLFSNNKYCEDYPVVTAEMLTSFHIPAVSDDFEKCVVTIRSFHVNFR